MAHTPPGRTRERVWQFVRERLLAGDPPTVREVQQAFGFRAVESARAHLEALVAEGRLEKSCGENGRDENTRGRRGPAARGRSRARGYRLPFASWGTQAPALVPVVGRVQAGALTTALEEPEGVALVQSRVPAEELFALRVRGDSMRDAGILDGDLVVVRRQETAEDGRIVVALVGEEATVKRLRLVREPGQRTPRVELHPENPAFDPIVPPPGEVRLLGRVVEVRRHLDDATSPPWETAGASIALSSALRRERGAPSLREGRGARGERSAPPAGGSGGERSASPGEETGGSGGERSAPPREEN